MSERAAGGMSLEASHSPRAHELLFRACVSFARCRVVGASLHASADALAASTEQGGCDDHTTQHTKPALRRSSSSPCVACVAVAARHAAAASFPTHSAVSSRSVKLRRCAVHRVDRCHPKQRGVSERGAAAACVLGCGAVRGETEERETTTTTTSNDSTHSRDSATTRRNEQPGGQTGIIAFGALIPATDLNMSERGPVIVA